MTYTEFMNTVSLAFKNIKNRRFRSSAIFLCVLVISGLFLSTSLLIQGAQRSVGRGMERLGADIVVLPDGVQTEFESALLMGKPSRVVMSLEVADKVSRVPGVAAISPQLYLTSLYNTVPGDKGVHEIFLIVIDPTSHFRRRRRAPHLDHPTLSWRAEAQKAAAILRAGRFGREYKYEREDSDAGRRNGNSTDGAATETLHTKGLQHELAGSDLWLLIGHATLATGVCRSKSQRREGARLRRFDQVRVAANQRCNRAGTVAFNLFGVPAIVRQDTRR